MQTNSKRLHGLDFARFLAFAGMVYVNFHVVTGGGTGAIWAEIFLLSLEGKAAATFVVLAGIGLGIGAKRATNNFNKTIIKRALFLFVLGIINSLIFPADILHYYAIYFLFALLFIRQSTNLLALIAIILPFIFVALLAIFDFDTGWNWQTYEYIDFWTTTGFFRNLFFNGWHPIIPWFSFLLLGIIISRLDLHSKKIQNNMVYIGAAFLIVAYALSALMQPFLFGEDVLLLGTEPVPPMPLYMLAGSGAALLIVGLCLWLYSHTKHDFLKPFSITGKQALTLYIAHIIIGMGVLEELNMLEGQSAQMAFFVASLFIIASIIYANIYLKFFKIGPIEWLLRKLTR